MTENGLTRMDISNYYYLWKKKEYSYDFSTNTYKFYDGNIISKDLLDFYHQQQIINQNRLYWNNLSWWKKLFKKVPYPL